MLAAFFTMAFTATVLTACGDDDDDDPTPSNYAVLSITLTDDVLAAYPDLYVTYQVPGKQPKVMYLKEKKTTIQDSFSDAGKVRISFNGTLDESKIVDENKYQMYISVSYEIYMKSTYAKSSETYGFGNTGAKIKQLNKTIEYSDEYGI